MRISPGGHAHVGLFERLSLSGRDAGEGHRRAGGGEDRKAVETGQARTA
ncbi:hypothetical protein SSAG_06162 [Streptomyces sp. Mg1]|nr:hypothetical protein SSAG_06162 [Streptomyces sp. Mg1]